MSYDGNGNYTPNSPEYPAVAGTLIKAADWNAIINDIASALSLVLVRDGQAAMVNHLNMGTKKVQNMADGAVSTDAVTYGQVLTAAILALKALTPAADKFPYFDGASSAAMLTIVAAIRTVLASADVATMRTNMGLGDSATKNTGTAAGTVAAGDHTHAGYQASDALLTALAALTTAADQLIYTTGVDTVGQTGLTAFARTILDDADAAAVRATISAQLADADTCISDVAKSYTAQHTPAVYSLTSGATIAFDNALCALATVTLAHNATLGDPSNKVNGQAGELIVTGASTYTLGVHANWKMADGTAVALVPAAGKKTWIWWECNGTYNYITKVTQEA